MSSPLQLKKKTNSKIFREKFWLRIFHDHWNKQLLFFRLFQLKMYSSTVTQFEDPPKKRLPVEEDSSAEKISLQDESGEQPLILRNVIGIGILHVLAVYSFYTSYKDAKFWTWIFSEYLIKLASIEKS